MRFDEIMSLCQTISVCIALFLLSFALIQWIIFSHKEHKTKMKLCETKLKEKEK